MKSSDRIHHIGQSGRNGETKHISKIGKADGWFFEGEAAAAFFMSKSPQNEKCANDLRRNGRNGNSGNFFFHYNTKNDVKNDIYDTGNDNVHQRSAAVSFSANDCRTEIINKNGGSTAHIDSEIDHRIVKAILIVLKIRLQ